VKHYELLRQCAARLQFAADSGESDKPSYLVLTWPAYGKGDRFPFSGYGTEMLSVNEAMGVINYRVPVKRIITAIGKAL
jgi:hypothetical protein